jgi:hypothetical protein
LLTSYKPTWTTNVSNKPTWTRFLTIFDHIALSLTTNQHGQQIWEIPINICCNFFSTTYSWESIYLKHYYKHILGRVFSSLSHFIVFQEGKIITYNRRNTLEESIINCGHFRMVISRNETWLKHYFGIVWGHGHNFN